MCVVEQLCDFRRTEKNEAEKSDQPHVLLITFPNHIHSGSLLPRYGCIFAGKMHIIYVCDKASEI